MSFLGFWGEVLVQILDFSIHVLYIEASPSAHNREK